MLTIQSGFICHNSDPIAEAPKSHYKALAEAWIVPESYRSNGYFVSFRPYGAVREEPACAGAVRIGSIEIAPDEDAVAAHNLESSRQRLRDAVTARRWEVMTGGISIGQMRVGTTIDDQNRITSVVANAGLAGLSDGDLVDFKAASGWVPLSIAQIKGIAAHIGKFVQACYSAERAHHDAIDEADPDGYDITTGWPDSEVVK